MSADKAPAEKLPLALRKNVRDGWEAKKADLEAQMEALVGVKWTFTCDPLVIYPYAEPGSYGHSSLGDCIHAYFAAMIWSLKNFVEKHGKAGVDELNTVCPTHICTFTPSTKFSYCGSIVADGQLQLVFHPKNLGSNIDNVASELAKALSAAPQPAGASSLSYAARHAIKTDYETEIGDMLEKAKKMLKNENFKFEPGFEAIGAVLKESKDVRDDWETNLGRFVKAYYGSFIDVLVREKFADDELLREGLEEGAPNGILRLRVVPKLKGGSGGSSYNELVIEDGDLVMQTTPSNWGTNIDYICQKLVDIL